MWSLELELGVSGDGVAVSTYTLATFAKRKRRLFDRDTLGRRRDAHAGYRGRCEASIPGWQVIWDGYSDAGNFRHVCLQAAYSMDNEFNKTGHHHHTRGFDRDNDSRIISYTVYKFTRKLIEYEF